MNRSPLPSSRIEFSIFEWLSQSIRRTTAIYHTTTYHYLVHREWHVTISEDTSSEFLPYLSGDTFQSNLRVQCFNKIHCVNFLLLIPRKLIWTQSVLWVNPWKTVCKNRGKRSFLLGNSYKPSLLSLRLRPTEMYGLSGLQLRPYFFGQTGGVRSSFADPTALYRKWPWIELQSPTELSI